MLSGNLLWQGGYVAASGNLTYRTRYSLGATPALRWPRTTFPADAGLIEKTMTLAATALTHMDLSTELNVHNVAAAFVRVLSIEMIVTSPGTVRFGPQSQPNAALLFFGAASQYVDVQDAFAWLGSGNGVTVTAPDTRVWYYNPGAAPVTFWVRIIGRTS